GAFRDVVGADDSRGAGAVLDDELLLERLRELGGEDARERVDRPARRIGRDELDDLGGPFLPERISRENEKGDENLKNPHSVLLLVSAFAARHPASPPAGRAPPGCGAPSPPARRWVSRAV